MSGALGTPPLGARPATHPGHARRLQLVPGKNARRPGSRAADHSARTAPDRSIDPLPQRSDERDAYVLVAGSDERERAHMLEELRSLLPNGTAFVEAGETWEVVARAPGSRMVVLTGELGELSPASLLRLLSRRHPGLPVLAMAESPRSDALARS